ncbi:tetratricopeptide repeat protein [Nonomuraea maheshkhaliensis]|uniref:tetratricopeptide repeat protein n=1 Tax=Nonomuraea maheshkhaliensis TaxID=419590 RepID=UPI003D158834
MRGRRGSRSCGSIRPRSPACHAAWRDITRACDARGSARPDFVELGKRGSRRVVLPLADGQRVTTAVRRPGPDLAQAIGNLDRQIFVLNKLGVVHRRLGRHHDALAHLRQALELARNIGTRLGQIDALTGLAALAEAGHRTTEALDHCTAALVLANDQGDPYNRAEIHDHLGRLHHRHSDQEQARHHWRQAAAIFTELGLPQADHIRTRLADC